MLDVLSTEDPASNSSVLLRIHYGRKVVYDFHLTHPVFPRYWSLAKSKHKDFFDPSKLEDVAHLFFRVLADNCQPIWTNFYATECIQRVSEYNGHVSWASSGRTCMPWTAYSNHKMIGEHLPGKSWEGSENQCRVLTDHSYNYDGKTMWCYTDLQWRKEECQVVTCNDVIKIRQCSSVPGFTNRNYPVAYALNNVYEYGMSEQGNVYKWLWQTDLVHRRMDP